MAYFERQALCGYFESGVHFEEAEDIEPSCTLFGGDDSEAISCDDVTQGDHSAHCWFLSTVSTIAFRYPDHIHSLITDRGDGNYAVRLYSYADKAWKEILVDSRLPVQDDDLVLCAMTSECALWPCLLQKAAAVYTGSYKNADGADPLFAMGMLTGCTDMIYLDPVEEDEPFGMWNMYTALPLDSDQPHDYDWGEHFDDEEDAMREFPFSELIEVLRELQRKGYPMCTSSDGHSISLLGVDETEDLIDLRDPYGRRFHASPEEFATTFPFITFVKWDPGYPPVDHSELPPAMASDVRNAERQLKKERLAKLSWYHLPARARQAAKVLGYTSRVWDNDGWCTAAGIGWMALGMSKQRAALALGYSPGTWEAERKGHAEEEGYGSSSSSD